MAIDVSDATFETEVLAKSEQVPVVVDLWAPWCGPCRTLGPIVEKVIGETDGKVVLAKINVDENPRASATFQVQGIPAVYAIDKRRVVNGFVGAQGEAAVREFVQSLLPSAEQEELAALIEAGDQLSLRKALDIEPDNESAIVKLAELLADSGQTDEALALLERIPETAETRRVAALARLGGEEGTPGVAAAADDDVDDKLNALLDRVKDDEEARQAFVDLLEVMGPDDPRTAEYRKALSARLF